MRRKELIEARNEADGLVYSVDRSLKELGDKVTAEEREEIIEAQEALKGVMGGEDIQAIKDKQEALSSALYKVTSRVYEAAGAASNDAPSDDDGDDSGDHETVDADFTMDDES
jgi:molecular chaperone DnaK